MPMNDQLQVEVRDGQVVRLLINNNWRRHGDGKDLAAALSDEVKSLLPRDGRAAPTGQPPENMNLTRLQRFMDMHREWHRRAEDYNRRATAGEFAPERPSYCDDGHHVELRFQQGRFDRVLIDPTWAEEATTQALMTTLLDAFTGVVLDDAGPGRGARDELHRLDQDIRDYAAQGW
ncbi:hypothetical protein [uncultured Tessaracoccus sp.]|uniref:hypothetical protein n=1 Tax=uncultured Tessaracoccus sp. TaxID=905023 RepID=UPI0025FE7FC7|nr:hypothetical protein [uncultured Tessaracoccus sp.]